MKKLFALFCFIAAPAFAASTAFDPLAALIAPGDEVSFSGTITCATCPPPPPPTILALPGNAHAGMHPSEAKAKGYAYCQTCHTPGGTTPALSVGKFICSQAQFCQQPAGIPGGKGCAVGVVAVNPLTGAAMTDPVSTKPIIGGGFLGVYAAGQQVRCSDCHNMSRNAGQPEYQQNRIHEGCLDCHVGVGREGLKPGVPR